MVQYVIFFVALIGFLSLLQEYWDVILFIVVMSVMFGYIFLPKGKAGKTKDIPQKKQNNKAYSATVSVDVPMKINNVVQVGADTNEYPPLTPPEIIEVYERRDYDSLRMYLQKIAYTMVNKDVLESDRVAFKEIMTFFASKDPLYKEVLRKVQNIIELEPGIIQSTIYKHLPKYHVETVRYVLYFAHELGDIVRTKKGRSYELNLPNNDTLFLCKTNDGLALG